MQIDFVFSANARASREAVQALAEFLTVEQLGKLNE